MECVLAFGGRRLNDKLLVFRKLDQIHAERGIALLGHGACPNLIQLDFTVIYSADFLAEEWAKSREISYRGWPAKWRTGHHGRAEGPMRNQRMLTELRPTLGVEFPGGAGTADMRKRLKLAGIEIV